MTPRTGRSPPGRSSGADGRYPMIQFPRRSVTRFFVPLIDVLTLLFCIFLLMPMVKPSAEATGMNQLANLEAQLQTKQEELERQRKEGGATEKLQEELKQLREETIKTLQERLQGA